MNSNLKKLISYLKEYKLSLAIVFCSLCVVAVSLLQIGSLFRNLIDKSLHNNDKISSINTSISHMLIVIIIFAIGSFIRSYFINIVTEKVIARIKTDGYKNLLQVEIAAFEELKIGDIVSRFGADLELVSHLITNFLSFFIRNSIMPVGAIIMMFFQSFKLSSLVIVSVPILLMPLLYLSKYVRIMSKKVMVEKSNLAAVIEETFSAVRIFHAFNRQHHAGSKFDEKMDIYIKHSATRLKFRSLFFALAIIVIASSITMVIWIGSIDIAKGNMTSGEMISFIYYAIIVGMSAGSIAGLFSEIQGPIAALERVFGLKKFTLSIASDEALIVPGDISFKNVNFSYPSRNNILTLNNISFVIKQGQFTGIVGKSGSGKSTIMQLLLSFYPYNSGNITIGNHMITAQMADTARKIIAYAPQDPTVFSGTIRYNIMFSKPNAHEQDVQDIVKLCGINSFIDSLPEGINTEIGEKGIRMSGGQKQRIAIARALLYRPEILLLDEATSALDSESEKEILDNVKTFMNNKIIILIAHRLSSIQDADNILVIEQGQLIASGRHRDLLKTSNIYFKLYTKSKIL